MPRRKREGTVVAPPQPSTSARTRQKASKPQLDKTPVENEVQQSMKTPVTRAKKPQVGFPDRLNWKMSHLRMPTTSTPKVDLTTKKVTERDVDTAFGFDDSCISDVGANYSTLISPIAHCSTGSGGGVWKINPLTQRNVEIDLAKPISRPDQENASEKRSVVSATRPKRNVKATSAHLKPSSSKKLNVKPTSTRSKIEATGKRRKKTVLLDDQDDVDDANANRTSPFSALLERYTDDKPTSSEAEGELHIDPKKIIRTYGSRKRVKISEDRETEYDFIPSSNVEINSEPKKNTKRKPNSKKPSSKTKSKKVDVLDEEAEKWLEEKNREFDDVLKVPLVIELSENSFSD